MEEKQSRQKEEPLERQTDKHRKGRKETGNSRGLGRQRRAGGRQELAWKGLCVPGKSLVCQLRSLWFALGRGRIVCV